MTACPDDTALEVFRLAPSAEIRAHVSQCDACLRRLAQMERLEVDFKRFVFPRTIERLTTLQENRGRRWMVLATLSVAMTIALVVATLYRPVQPDADYVGIKGRSLGLSVFALGNDGTPQLVVNNSRVSAAAKIRFSVKPSSPCWLWVFSLDNTGQMSRLFPIEGESVRIQEETTLPGGAALDGMAGFERFVAVCAAQPISYATLAEIVQRQTVGDAQVVNDMSAVAGLPSTAMQESLLLEKIP